MKEIELTQGRVALVDDEDFEELNRFKWFAHRWRHGWYAKRNLQRVEGKRPFLSMHCQIMGKISGLEMDHRDGNGLNNQKDNLRFATRSQNMANRKPSQKVQNIRASLGTQIRKNGFLVYGKIKSVGTWGIF